MGCNVIFEPHRRVFKHKPLPNLLHFAPLRDGGNGERGRGQDVRGAVRAEGDDGGGVGSWV